MFLIIVDVLGHPKGVGGLTSYFLRGGGMDVFWNDPLKLIPPLDVMIHLLLQQIAAAQLPAMCENKFLSPSRHFLLDGGGGGGGLDFF